MEDTFQNLTQPRNSTTTAAAPKNHSLGCEDDNDDDEEKAAKDDECDKEVWDTLRKSFRQVQSVLDQNRALIQQVNENHQSKLPDHLVKNVDLIREINGNISKIMSLYSDLSVNFSNIVQQRRVIKNNDGDEKEENNVNGD